MLNKYQYWKIKWKRKRRMPILWILASAAAMQRSCGDSLTVRSWSREKHEESQRRADLLSSPWDLAWTLDP